MNQTNKVAAIHDMSGIGRCSLAVIIPILSVLKSQVCAIPTTILSTHTGGFGEVAIRDLKGYIGETLQRYQALHIEFQCIYSGYLGDVHHFEECLLFFKSYPHALKVVDPVMGDHGKVYRMFTNQRIQKMIALVGEADLITPNMTEVYLLLQEPYQDQPLSLQEYFVLLQRLSALGPSKVVITGAALTDARIANLGYDRDKKQFYDIPCYYSDVHYPGTGDIFASVVIGHLLQQKSLPESIELATRFIEHVIRVTYETNSDTRFGVEFEQELSWLLQPLGSYEYQEVSTQ